MQHRTQHPLRVTVVITAWKDSPELRRTIAVVRRQARRAGATSLLMFNAWQDDVPHSALVELEREVDQVLFEPRPGKSIALNTAVLAVPCEVMVFTEDKIVPSEDWLARLVAPFEADKHLAGAGGPVERVYKDGPSWFRNLESDGLGLKRVQGGHYMGDSYRLYDRPGEDELGPVPTGKNYAWRRNWLERFPFRENLGANRVTGTCGGEDVCLGLQVLQAGGRVAYVPRAVMYDPVEQAEIRLDHLRRRYGASGREVARILRALGRPVPEPGRIGSAFEGITDTLAWLGPPGVRIRRELGRTYQREFVRETKAG